MNLQELCTVIPALCFKKVDCIKRLNSFYMRCLCKVLKINWKDKIPEVHRTDTLTPSRRSGYNGLAIPGTTVYVYINEESWVELVESHKIWREHLAQREAQHEAAFEPLQI